MKECVIHGLFDNSEIHVKSISVMSGGVCYVELCAYSHLAGNSAIVFQVYNVYLVYMRIY